MLNFRILNTSSHLLQTLFRSKLNLAKSHLFN